MSRGLIMVDPQRVEKWIKDNSTGDFIDSNAFLQALYKGEFDIRDHDSWAEEYYKE